MRKLLLATTMLTETIALIVQPASRAWQNLHFVDPKHIPCRQRFLL